jgi:hypothetical protein
LATGQLSKLWDNVATQPGLAAHAKGSEMASTLGDPPLLTDSDVDALAWQFLNSPYADNKTYADWPLDRRLDGFLRRQGLVRLAEDGDAYDLILNRVLAYIGRRVPPRF